ncbi:hypothetical protein Esti_005100 [Eimeria stiedai]
MEGSPLPAALPSSREDLRGSGNQQNASDEAPGARSEGPVFKQHALEGLPRPPSLPSAGSQERGSISRSTSSSETVGSVISLAVSSYLSSPRSSAGDAGRAPAFSLKWGKLLDSILEDQKHSTSRLDDTADPPTRPPTIKQRAWDSLLTRETADEAGDILRKFTDLSVFASRPPPVPPPEFEEDLERGEAVSGAGRLDPSQCRVYGPGLQERIAGVLSEFFIHAVTVDGRYASHGGARFVVYVEPVEDPHRGEEGSLLSALDPPRRAAPTLGSDGSKHRQSLAQVLDNEDGTCTVFFSCSVAVRHQVTILLDDKYPVAASPYIVSVVPGSVDALKTVAHGESLQRFQRDGELNDFVIQARDGHGNNIKRGGDKFCVEGLGAIKVVETLDFNDGLYRVKFFVRAGCEEQYCQLNVLYDGQHIEGSPFYPKPVPLPTSTPTTKTLPKGYGAMYLMNPSKSLLGAMGTFYSRMKQTPGPKLPTFPAFPSKTETDDILRKLMDNFEPSKVRTKDADALLAESLAKVRKQLRQCLYGLMNKEEDLDNMLECIRRHVSAGLLHAKIEERGKDEFGRLIGNVAQIQKQLHTTYKSLQHRVADSLPVTFELEDPKEIKRVHTERRSKLLQVHSQLEAKERELRAREKRIKEQISSYMAQLSTDLKARENALEMERKALETNTHQVLKLTSNRLKLHARREALIACEREPVEAKKSEFWQKEFQRMLEETPVVSAQQKDVATKTPSAVPKVSSAGRTRQVETRPLDPNSIAFWLAEKQYIAPQKHLFRSPDDVLLDDRAAYRKINLRRGNPSRVTFTQSRIGDT